MSTHNMPFISIRKENHPKLSKSAWMSFFFLGTQERVRNSHGKRAISVRATEVLLYVYAWKCLSDFLVKDNVYLLFFLWE